ncbi:glycosyltransferase family 4 protein [Pseudomonas panipatensis]|uniref:Alpha-1,3-rhamnosyl/mannosyltransferase n=1 Tax=Pseudomonas panipatensis TaxID=428992 RepID=A0A1G8LUU6_9PSED|nr:glycosyltransferase family 1 protein [Pseudomonas panipatensis]SDI59474.1 alpha-1,3-rhamnosyl/mannosyltransferase [Pseudomonas panipatensis]SMP47160.1 alpha-1,3-rhamnosyl/mannosyltransferase [Pseudomonas panipatensis]
MRVALNARILQAPRTGIGQYVAALSEALGSLGDIELDYFHGWGWGADLPQAALPGYSRWSALAKQVPGAYRIRRWLEQGRFERGLRRRRVDLYHEPSLWPLDFDGPMVMTLHDLTHVRYPETQPRDRLAEIERRVGEGVGRASRILTDSHFVADEIRAHFGLPEQRVVVAPLGYAPRFHPRSAEALRDTLAPFGLAAGGYLLCVGTLEPRKNLELALRAYLRLPAVLRARFPLLIAGMPGWRSEQLNATLGPALASGQVRLLGYQSDQVLAELLAGARLLLFPSRYEGFGLPVLEAMASGVPVVLARTSSLPEVAGEAGCFVAPDDDEAMAEAMLRLLEDDEEWGRRRSLGLRRAEAFSWSACARITADTYRQAMGD